MKRLISSIVGICFALSLFQHPAIKAQETRATTLKERPLINLQSYEISHSATTSDLRRVALVVKRQGKHVVIVDGKEEPPVKKVRGMGFSPDGKRFVYAAELDGSKETIVVDGKPGKSFDEIKDWTFALAGQRVAYVVKQNGKQSVIVFDESEFGPYETAGNFVFSPDGLRFAFNTVVAKGSPVTIVIDGKQHEGSLAFETRGIISQQVRFGYPSGESVFGPDSKKTIYLEGVTGKWYLVIDGVRQNAEPCEFYPDIKFSTDGLHRAFTCLNDRKVTVYLDGKPLSTHKGSVFAPITVGDLRFSPNGKRLLYLTRRGISEMSGYVDGSPITGIIDNGKEIEPDSFGTTPIFSPDSSYVAWGGFGAVFKDKVLQKITNRDKMNVTGIFSIVFSPDGQRMAYVASDSSSQLAIVDHKIDRPASKNVVRIVDVNALTFSPDSKHTAYLAFDAVGGKRSWVAVIDGVERGRYDGGSGPLNHILLRPVWDSPTALRYLAIKDGTLIEVTETIGTPN